MDNKVKPLNNVEIKTLADKAMLVRLARKRMRTSLRDKTLEQRVRHEQNDDSLTITKHLFRDPDSPVRKLMQAYDEVYRLHKEHTMPWIDRGPRLLPSHLFFDHMERMRSAIADVESRIPDIERNWESLVQEDIRKRGGRASRDDYVNRHDVGQMFSIDLQAFPLPDTGDFRVQVDDSTRDALQGALQDAEQQIRADLIRRMLEPTEKAIEKLSVPIGEKGGVFRDSLVNNLFDGVRRAKELNITDDPDLTRFIEEVEARISAVLHPQALRQDQTKRDAARKELKDIMGKLGGM